MTKVILQQQDPYQDMTLYTVVYCCQQRNLNNLYLHFNITALLYVKLCSQVSTTALCTISHVVIILHLPLRNQKQLTMALAFRKLLALIILHYTTQTDTSR